MKNEAYKSLVPALVVAVSLTACASFSEEPSDGPALRAIRQDVHGEHSFEVAIYYGESARGDGESLLQHIEIVPFAEAFPGVTRPERGHDAEPTMPADGIRVSLRSLDAHVNADDYAWRAVHTASADGSEDLSPQAISTYVGRTLYDGDEWRGPLVRCVMYQFTPYLCYQGQGYAEIERGRLGLAGQVRRSFQSTTTKCESLLTLPYTVFSTAYYRAVVHSYGRVHFQSYVAVCF